MNKTIKTFLTTLCLLLATVASWAQTIEELQKQMYAYFSSPERDKFFEVTEQLKEACLQQNDERTFYKAWGNQAIYETTHQNRNHAMEIAKEMKAYATDHNSLFGQYTALHVMATVYYQMKDYAEAERHFLESIDFLHTHFPGESAAAAYLELTKINNTYNNTNEASEYAQKALNEPGVSVQHQMRALTMLCQIAYARGQRDDFNRYYEHRAQVRRQTTADALEPVIDVMYRIINNDYEQARQQAEQLPSLERTELLADIYHRQGNDTQAFDQLQQYVHIKDSLNNVRQGDLVSDYATQLNAERLEAERLAMEKQMRRQNDIYRLITVLLLLAFIGYVVSQRYLRLRRRAASLTKDNAQLSQQNEQLDEARRTEQHAREEAEQALDVKRELLNDLSRELRMPLNPITGFSDILATPGFELAPEERTAMSQHIKDSSKVLTSIIDNMIELSFYESKTSLPLNDNISPHVLCMHATDELRPQCQPGVEMKFETDLPNGITIRTDLESVEKVLRHLLGNAVRFTTQGTITLSCDRHDDLIAFVVTDTGATVSTEMHDHLFEASTKSVENVRGNNMSLAISQAIAKLLGGTLQHDSTYQQGCRFVFEVPIGE